MFFCHSQLNQISLSSWICRAQEFVEYDPQVLSSLFSTSNNSKPAFGNVDGLAFWQLLFTTQSNYLTFLLGFPLFSQWISVLYEPAFAWENDTKYSSIMPYISRVFVQAVPSLFIYIVGNNPGKEKEIG